MLALVGVTVLVGCGNDDNGGGSSGGSESSASCDDLRGDLVTAKQDRISMGMEDPQGIQGVDNAARAARSAGCNIDDLVGPNVGR